MPGSGGERRISRRNLLRGVLAVPLVAPLAACTPGPVVPAPPAPRGTPEAGAIPAGGPARGGILRAAIVAEPPTLDPHWTAATATASVVWHVVETLFTLDKSYRVVPMLAEGLDTADGGRARTLRLRKGVRFHNGKEMTAGDVEASLVRWGLLSALGREVLAYVEALERKDQHTLVFRLKRPLACFEAALCYRAQGAAIMPSEQVGGEAARAPVAQPIGTGPYRLAEHERGRQVRLVRFDGYAAGGTKPDLPGGRKGAFFDEIRFLPVADQAVRIAGVRAGEYDYAEGINPDQHQNLKDDRAVALLVGDPGKTPVHYLNFKSRVTSDRKLRQAILAAVDPEAALKAAWKSSDLYRLNGGLMPEAGPWHSEAGVEGYNQRNFERARSLLKESDYTGEPVRYLTTRDYPTMLAEATVLSQQLQALGLNVKLEVMDWTSLVSRRAKAEDWEVFSTWYGFVADPSLADWSDPGYPGWWSGEMVDRLREELRSAIDPKERFAALERLQQLAYEDVPLLKLGEVSELFVINPRLKAVETLPFPAFWNAYFSR